MPLLNYGPADKKGGTVQPTRIHIDYGSSMHRGMIYVMRQVNGVFVPLRIDRQSSYREWLGCFSAI